MRILLLLSEAHGPMNKDKIAALDFMSIYGRSCGLLDTNINGENRFNFAEFARKRELVTEGLSEAVRRDLVSVSTESNGFSYSLNDRGLDIVRRIESSYASQYLKAASSIISKLEDSTDIELLELINKKANEAKDDGYAELLD